MTDGEATPERLQVLREVLRRRLDAIVLTPQAFRVLAGVLESEKRPRIVEQTDHYLMLTQPSRGSESTARLERESALR